MDGGGNSVRGNRITRGSLSLAPGFSGSLVRDNTVSGAGPGSDVGGIRVAAGAMNNVLLSNTASGSADDGISVDEPTTTLTANRAFGNADFGIKAVAGVVDGGGNRAWGNGNPLQCLNVQC
jgi:parallel beta-helix repeat protein